MKLGEIKLETLMMICPGELFEYDTDTLKDKLFDLRQNPNFSDFLASMPSAINRCFASLEQKGIIPTKQVELTKEKASLVGGRQRYLLNEIITDFGSVDRVAHYSSNKYTEACDYSFESADVLLLEDVSGTYVVIYTPKIERVHLITSEEKEIALPHDICSIIPYFVKSEILRSEAPDEASIARNIYEQMAGELITHKDSYQASVKNTYRID